jgi:hypothetical protein
MRSVGPTQRLLLAQPACVFSYYGFFAVPRPSGLPFPAPIHSQQVTMKGDIVHKTAAALFDQWWMKGHAQINVHCPL